MLGCWSPNMSGHWQHIIEGLGGEVVVLPISVPSHALLADEVLKVDQFCEQSDRTSIIASG